MLTVVSASITTSASRSANCPDSWRRSIRNLIACPLLFLSGSCRSTTVAPCWRAIVGGIVRAVVGDHQHLEEALGILERKAASDRRGNSRFLVMCRNHDQKSRPRSVRLAGDPAGAKRGQGCQQDQTEIRQKQQVDADHDRHEPER